MRLLLVLLLLLVLRVKAQESGVLKRFLVRIVSERESSVKSVRS
jgi:hypothetical protein